MRKFLTVILLGAFVMAGLGAPAAEAASSCNRKNDLPGQWWFSLAIVIGVGSPTVPALYLNCRIVYSKGSGIKVNQSRCTDSFGSGYSPTFGSSLSVNKKCRVEGQLVLTAIGQGSGSSNLFLAQFQTGSQVSVVVTLDNLRMVSDKLSMHGSGIVTYSGTSTGGSPTSLTVPGSLNVIKK